ncbi:unnamed protein product [Phyllotreta striolata]|uniref:RZ-type domain-containing protein n=1 Tax=Phyllotreta striolata TaxID=444603 RepID=A0A9N9TMW9_PHYSR|nr:unnamed protein product [Phyllotreta striolata]
MKRRESNDNRRVAKNPERSSSNWKSRDGSNTKESDKINRGNVRKNEEKRSKNGNFKEKQSFSRENNNASGSRSHGGRREVIMGFKMTQELLENDDIEDVIFRLSNNEKSFKNLLDDYKMQPDIIVLIAKLIAKISESDFNTGKTHLLNVVLSSNFLEILIKFISTVAVQNEKEKIRNKYLWKDTDDFFLNVISISKVFNNLLPSNSCEMNHKVLRTLKLNLTIIEEAHNIHISDDIKNQIEQLLGVVEKIMEEIEQKKNTKQYVKKVAVTDDLLEPPDDFRSIDVFPNAAEIANRQTAFLRTNVIAGPYKDVEHYLDIQFRLYREDFVIPLRYDICNYINDNRCKLENTKIYKGVKFIIKQMRGDSNVYVVQYDFSKTKKSFQYENSKRFMYGSLLSFTQDGFKTMFFGTVAGRDLKLLENGQILVKIVTPNFDLPADLFQLGYIMVESTVFFEPYLQILNCLKQLSSDNFPMERYIINVETSSGRPKYLLDNAHMPFNVDGSTFSPLQWNRHFPDLNQAQNAAFEAAITDEFVLIQGPPGTGKTFLGLKIAKTLLENSHIWYRKTPMLIICYTNHALDQFLEGLLDTTKELIRVGKQSKNEKLEPFNIHNFRRNRRKPDIIQHLRAEERKMFSILENINTNLMHIESYSSILNFNLFEAITGNFRDSWFAEASNENILDWLLQYQINYKINTTNNASEQLTEVPPNDDAPLPIELDENKDENEELFQANNESYLTDDDDNITVISIESLLQKKCLLERELRKVLSNDYCYEYDNGLEEYLLNVDLYNTTNCLEELSFRMQERRQLGEATNPPTYVNLQNPHLMSMDQRWQLYFHWLFLLKRSYYSKRERLGARYKDIYIELKEYEAMEDAQIMKEAKVIGMTTTCAARLKSSLQVIKSPIVIVEEAAEILESHVVTSLTQHCEHLILIGDHQQLKPSTATYKIETTYRLDVSLFERMIMNGMKCHTLDVQHRMRPEIANLIRTNIYKTINDHSSVLNREHIRGINCDLFFIDHTEKEVCCDNGSKKNVHEAKFLIQLASYLVLNGYRPDQIILLAAYLGQMYEMQRERRNYRSTLENVRIAVLDNYQGEECDIVLLSLVRSNAENKIGFLNKENRVCVALSRARNGFYIMGNMKQLCAKSKIWTKIEHTLINQEAIGKQLMLRCQVHNKMTAVSKFEDFFRLSEGGCDLPCGKDLNCGHTCTRLCHSLDREHAEYKCLVKCNKPLCENEQHLCKKVCYKICGPCTYLVERTLQCGHHVNIACSLDPEAYNCTEKVEVTLNCGHKVAKPCFVKVENFACPVVCDTRVEPCGHSCIKKCHVNNDPDHLEYKCKKICGRQRKGCTDSEHEPCNKLCYEDCAKCAVSVLKKRTACDHMFRIACSANPDDIDCEKPCKRILPCNHQCPRKCNEPCGNCQKKVEKIIPECNHTILTKCSEVPTRNKCTKNCQRLLKCGHKCNKKCNETCNKQCEEIVDCSINSPCGHTINKIYCYISGKSGNIDELLMRHCLEKCGAQLECGHRCTGTCGACYQGRYHVRCQEKCGVILVCNHECGIPCREACRPCNKPCEYICKHSKCKKTCGNPCTMCKENCPRQCAHQKCKRKCGQLCDVPPCTKPCAKKIKCGHPCVGFCGDPCPQLCRICDKEQLTETFFGTEADEDARFVLLEDCGHILESEGMEYWLKQGDSGYEDTIIKPIECPKCKTTIRKSSRYSDYVKENMQDLLKVKSSFYGTEEEIGRLSMKLEVELTTNLTKLSYSIGSKVPILESFFKTAKNRLAPICRIQNFGSKVTDSRRNTINKMNLNDIRIKMDLIKLMLDSVSKFNEMNNKESSIDQMDFIGNLIVGNGVDSITQQEITDIKLEINRLNRLVQLNSIPNYSTVVNKKEEVKNLILKKCRYDDNLDKSIKEKLEELKKSTSSPINITDVEKKEIVQALGLTPGHWFKCPNGHPYIITECGGAMQTSRCNECQAPIGGSNHTLLATNALASEMDGSRHAAWSDTANMANYRL